MQLQGGKVFSGPQGKFRIFSILFLFSVVLSAQETEELKIEGVSLEGTTLQLNINGDNDLYYVLKKYDNITDRGKNISLELGGGNEVQLRDTKAQTGSAFYRIVGFPKSDPRDLDSDGINDLYEMGRGSLDPFNPFDRDKDSGINGETELLLYQHPYEIGRARYDITGVSAGDGMMGYANPSQKSAGIHDRQWARAFIVKDRTTERHVAHVVVENGQLFQSVYQGVCDRIKQNAELNKYYSYQNIVLSATHTHGAAGNHSHFTLYHSLTGGFSWRTYDAMVHGIYMAILNAHRDLKPGSISLNLGHLENANENRRPEAFSRNLEQRNEFLAKPFGEDNRDKEMALIKLFHRDEGPVGMFNWFPVHGVSVSKLNELLTSDNKGYAAFNFEKQQGSVFPGFNNFDPRKSTFVAGFINSNPGDLTANRSELPKPEKGATGYYDEFTSEMDFQRANTIGQRQLDYAKKLYDGEEGGLTHITGDVDYRHRYVDMNNYIVKPNKVYPYNVEGVNYQDRHFLSTSGEFSVTTCRGKLGIEFTAGTDDGEGFDLGALQSIYNATTIPPPELCDFPKDLGLVTASKGENNKGGRTPHWMPVSILKVGNLVILAVPAELTSTAGYRLKRSVQNVFEQQGQHVKVILSGLSNSYSGYVTTYEEYMYEKPADPLFENKILELGLISSDSLQRNSVQSYEAASTHFGPFTLVAYQQIFKEMAGEIIKGSNVPVSPIDSTMPENVRSEPIDPTTDDKKVVLDVPPLPSVEILPATYQEEAGCPPGQFNIVLTEDCWICPEGFDREDIIVDPLDACKKDERIDLSPATERGMECNQGGTYHVLAARCLSCPSGYSLNLAGDNCEKTGQTLSERARDHGSSNLICAPDQFYDVLTSKCYSCPSGFKDDILAATDSGQKCVKPAVIKKDTAPAERTDFIGFGDCPDGYTPVFAAGCYKCPAGFTKGLATWGAADACFKDLSTPVQYAKATEVGDPNCPSGQEFDVFTGKCWSCRDGFEKPFGVGWDRPDTCRKKLPDDFRSPNDLGPQCPTGQFYDVLTDKCWSCPVGFEPTLASVTEENACRKIILKQTVPAENTNIKFACEDRDSNWILDIGLNQCWSCPEGSVRNLNPVDGGEACNKVIPGEIGIQRAAPIGELRPGGNVEVSFWSGHPKNVFGQFQHDSALKTTNIIDTFYEVQRKLDSPDNSWITVHTDSDWTTEFHWTPQGLSGSSTFKWRIPETAALGTYRFLHRGVKSSLTGVNGVEVYESYSSEFEIN